MVNIMKIEFAINDFINYCVFEKGLSEKTKDSYFNDLKIYKMYLTKFFAIICE